MAFHNSSFEDDGMDAATDALVDRAPAVATESDVDGAVFFAVDTRSVNADLSFAGVQDNTLCTVVFFLRSSMLSWRCCFVILCAR